MSEWREQAAAEIRDGFETARVVADKAGTIAANLTVDGPDGMEPWKLREFADQWERVVEALWGSVVKARELAANIEVEDGR